MLRYYQPPYLVHNVELYQLAQKYQLFPRRCWFRFSFFITHLAEILRVLKSYRGSEPNREIIMLNGKVRLRVVQTDVRRSDKILYEKRWRYLRIFAGFKTDTGDTIELTFY